MPSLDVYVPINNSILVLVEEVSIKSYKLIYIRDSGKHRVRYKNKFYQI